jgi:hypothetical protein
VHLLLSWHNTWSIGVCKWSTKRLNYFLLNDSDLLTIYLNFLCFLSPAECSKWFFLYAPCMRSQSYWSGSYRGTVERDISSLQGKGTTKKDFVYWICAGWVSYWTLSIYIGENISHSLIWRTKVLPVVIQREMPRQYGFSSKMDTKLGVLIHSQRTWDFTDRE